MSDYTLQLAAGGDDGWWFQGQEPTISSASDTPLGVYAGSLIHCFYRFASPAALAAGSVVGSAKIRFKSIYKRDGTVTARIHLAATKDPSAPTTLAQLNALALSESYVEWVADATSLTAGTVFDSPDLSGLIMAQMSRPDWSPGDHLLFVLKTQSTSGSDTRFGVATYEGSGSTDAPNLLLAGVFATIPAVVGFGGTPNPSVPLALPPAVVGLGTTPAPTARPVYGVTLTAIRRIPLGRELTAVRRLPLGRVLIAVRRIPAPLGVTLTAVRRVPVEIGRELTAVRRILDHNPLGVTLTAMRRIPSSGSALRRSVPWSAVWDDDGSALELLGATLSGDRDSLAWSCDLSLADAEAYAACTSGRRLTLALAGRSWALLIEGRTREAACGTRDYAATARTVSCLLDAPYAALLTQSWPAVTAKGAAVALAALAGLTLDWRVVDWTLPAGRLTAEAETPAALIARLAASCGGVAMPDPAGGVLVRYAYPVGVPEMATAAPVATLSDDEDVETLGETFVAGAGYNAVTVVDNRQTTEAYLAWELDSDRNAGRSTFPPGEPCYLRVYHEEDYSVKTSLGLLELVTTGIEETVDKVVGFADADSTDLGGLVVAVEACVWYGPDLGTLVPSGGGTVTASAGAGFSVAAVSYRTRYDLWRLTAPAVADAYTIQLGLEEVEP